MDRPSAFWSWLGRGADLYTLLLFVLGVPALIAAVVSGLTLVLRSSLQALVVFFVLFVVLLVMLSVVAAIARRQAASHPDVRVEASSGPSDEVRVAVTNLGKDATFRIHGRVTARIHDNNAYRNTVFSLAWVANLQASMPITRGQTENALVAKFLILPPEGRVMERMGEMQVMECKAAGLAVVDWVRWSFYKPYQPVLPELHIQLSLHATGYPRPLVRNYALRPAGQYGPLELVELTPTERP